MCIVWKCFFIFLFFLGLLQLSYFRIFFLVYLFLYQKRLYNIHIKSFVSCNVRVTERMKEIMNVDSTKPMLRGNLFNEIKTQAEKSHNITMRKVPFFQKMSVFAQSKLENQTNQ